MVRIDKEKCIRCGTCASMCPEGFGLEDDGVEVKNTNASCVGDAANSCPTGAIILDETEEENPKDEESLSDDMSEGDDLGEPNISDDQDEEEL